MLRVLKELKGQLKFGLIKEQPQTLKVLRFFMLHIPHTDIERNVSSLGNQNPLPIAFLFQKVKNGM